MNSYNLLNGVPPSQVEAILFGILQLTPEHQDIVARVAFKARNLVGQRAGKVHDFRGCRRRSW